tara:strand:- start:5177 stop:5743 length:567 start_codon:yes stop_codon:yes gene_type:complete
MRRRDVLKYAAYASGAAVSSPLFNSILSGTVSNFLNRTENYKPLFLNEQQFMLLRDIADAILPKTDSPSASEVGVPATIDAIIGNAYSKKDQQEFKKRFSNLEVYLKRQNFSESDQKKKVAILSALNDSKDEKLGLTRWAYIDIKQQTISYYLSSEEIGENYLNYLPVPGYYDPCITLESVNGKAWSI